MALLHCRAIVNKDGSFAVSEQDRQQLKLHPGDAVTLRIVTADAPEIEMNETKETKKRVSKRKQSNWEQERQLLTDELTKIWPEGISVTDIVSEMRK